MIYVFEGGSIVFDGNTISEEQKAQAIAVESLPVPEVIAGKKAILKADKATNTVGYDYVENTEVTKLQELLDDATSLLIEGGLL